MEKLTFVTDDNENVELYIIEETRANGVNYLLVTDSSDEEDTDAECYILKDTSSEADAEADAGAVGHHRSDGKEVRSCGR